MSKLDPTGKPMMADREIKIIDDFIEQIQAKRVLEFGSGNSTNYFSAKHDCIERWVALENAQDYFEIARDKALSTENKKVNVHFIQDRYAYVHTPLQWGKFDFIFVDGIDREDCVETALKLIVEGGVILLHDSARIESAPILKRFKHEILCDGELPQSSGFMAHRGLARILNIQ